MTPNYSPVITNQLDSSDANDVMSNLNSEFSGGNQPAFMPYLVSSLMWILIFYSIVFIFNLDVVRGLTREDHFVEFVGAALFLSASVTYFVLYKRSRQIVVFDKIPFRGNIFYLLLGLVFLFVCLEEISWGQRIIGFQAPESLRGVNAQGEFNIHNLRIFHGKTETGDRKDFWSLLLNMDRLFSIFWFSYCCLVPVLYRFAAPIKGFLDRIRMPIVPMFLAGVFLFNYVATKIMEKIAAPELHHSTVEIKETNIAMLFFVLALWFIRSDRHQLADNKATT